jgi:5-methylcytosine-specific restriction endonuclease McrA
VTDHILTKTCPKCGLNLPTSGFHKWSQNPDKSGLARKCKSCIKIYQRARYEANREEILQKNKAWYDANRKEVDEYQRDYYQVNRERLNEYHRAYAKANPEKVAGWMKKWYQANPDKRRAHNQNRRARQRNAEGVHTSEQVQARFEVHGNTCIYCGSPDDLHVDHIKPLGKSGSNWASNLAPACARCNLSKNDKWGKALLRWLKQNCTVARTSRILTAILT